MASLLDTMAEFDIIFSKEDWTGTAGVYRFDTAFVIDPSDAKAVSDHYPVYAEFSVDQDSD